MIPNMSSSISVSKVFFCQENDFRSVHVHYYYYVWMYVCMYGMYVLI